MVYASVYGYYQELLEKGTQTIYTKDIDSSNIDTHFYNIIAILQDGIETREVQNMIITVVFVGGETVELSIFDYLFNLLMWGLTTSVNAPITFESFFYLEDITKSGIKNYIDNVFIKKYRKSIDFMSLNNIIDNSIGKFRDLRNFQMYLANTMCFEDTIELMRKYKEFNDTIHLDISGVPLEATKEVGMEATHVQIKYIKNSNHCMRDNFRTGEGINTKQYKEVAVNIGPKPDGQGTVFPQPINTSFINGGLNCLESIFEDSSVGRVAQILQKKNVGTSGDFARKLGLNNQDTRLHHDPSYKCDTRNLLRVTIKNSTMLEMYNMRYYRENPRGVDKLLDADKDKDLIGRTLWFRSPMKCASAARGEGICYACYGDLAYVNRDINVGQIASELLSSILTQILLSAKHLLEAAVIEMKWNEGFFNIFSVDFNTISVREDIDTKGMSAIFDVDSIENDDEFDDFTYSDYISSFTVKLPNGQTMDICTSEYDPIYISPDLMDLINNAYDSQNDTVSIDFNQLKNLPTLFSVEIKNNELSDTMNKIKNLINNKKELKHHTASTLLEHLIDTNIKGRIQINAVHFEVLLMNQIRAVDDIIEVPDWTVTGEQYQLLSLDDALANSRYLTIRLQNNSHLGIVKTLTNPRLRDLYKPSIMDVYFMEKPQDFLVNQEHISDKFQSETDIESNKITPVHFPDEVETK